METEQKGEKYKTTPPWLNFSRFYFVSPWLAAAAVVLVFFGGGELCGADDLFVPRWGGALRERESPVYRAFFHVELPTTADEEERK